MVCGGNPKDIVAAKKLGFLTIWLKVKGWQEENKSEDCADIVIETLNEIISKEEINKE